MLKSASSDTLANGTGVGMGKLAGSHNYITVGGVEIGLFR